MRKARQRLDLLESPLEASLGDALQRSVDRRVDFQSSVVELVAVDHELEFSENGIHRPVVLRGCAALLRDLGRGGDGGDHLLLGDEIELAHARQNSISLADGFLQVVERRKAVRTSDKPGEHRGLREVHQ